MRRENQTNKFQTKRQRRDIIIENPIGKSTELQRSDIISFTSLFKNLFITYF